jgi:Holliday junction resolvase
MSLSRKNPKRDGNEREIIDALQAVGAQVWQVSGKGCPDLLVRFGGHWQPLEVKTKRGRLTVNQTYLLWPVVRTVDESLRAIGAMKC